MADSTQRARARAREHHFRVIERLRKEREEQADQPDLAAGDHFAGMPEDLDNGLSMGQIKELEQIGMDADNANVAHDSQVAYCEHSRAEGMSAIEWHQREAGRQAVLNEITDEVDSGNAHLMTRNELVEFMNWWVNGESADDQPLFAVGDDANSMIHEAMDEGRDIDKTRCERVAKAFFVRQEYENPA